MYAVSLYRYDVCIYSGSRGQIEIFVRKTSRFLAWYFCYLGVNWCHLFYDCNSFGSLGEVFAHEGEFPLAFLTVVG